ncbi:MAG: hypothetical protein WAL05_04580, partial [Candidatus Sulfotelmatobacter sp.]
QASLGWKRQTINESEMALFSECSLKCVRKLLDTADIVRDAIFHQSTKVMPITATKVGMGCNLLSQ